MLTEEQIKLASKLSFNNYEKLLDSQMCACYHCLKTYPASELTEFTSSSDTSALCIFCGVDSILPENSEIALTQENLQQLQAYWFSATVQSKNE